jgi:glutaredoxin
MKPEVTIYTMNGCPFCTRAKTYFTDKGIEAKEINVDVQKDKVREVVQMNPKGSFPTMVINGRIVVGFVPQLIDDALSRTPPPKREVVTQNLLFDLFDQ